MGSYIIPLCSGACSGCGTATPCSWPFGCGQWPDVYIWTDLLSGNIPSSSGNCWPLVAGNTFGISNAVNQRTAFLYRPAPINSPLCSWGNTNCDNSCGMISGFVSGGNVVITQLILRFDGVGGLNNSCQNSGNALNCDNTISGLYYGVLFSVLVCASNPIDGFYYVTSGYINSGAWNCSGPTTLFIGPNTAYNTAGCTSETGTSILCSSGSVLSGAMPNSITITPVF